MTLNWSRRSTSSIDVSHCRLLFVAEVALTVALTELGFVCGDREADVASETGSSPLAPDCLYGRVNWRDAEENSLGSQSRRATVIGATTEPDTGALRCVVAAYLGAMEGTIPMLTSANRSDLHVRHFAACALARSVQAIRAIHVVADNGLRSQADVLARAALELAIDGLYVLLGGDRHLKVLMRAHKRTVEYMNSELGLELDEALDMWTFDDDTDEAVKKERPTFEARVKWVAGELKSRERDLPEHLSTTIYDLAYRSLSILGVHSFGAANQHLRYVESANRLEVDSAAAPTAHPDALSAIMALYAGQLAEMVCEAHGIGVDGLTQRAEDVGAALRQFNSGIVL